MYDVHLMIFLLFDAIAVNLMTDILIFYLQVNEKEPERIENDNSYPG